MSKVRRRLSEAVFDFQEMADLINIFNEFCLLYELEIGQEAQEHLLEEVLSQYYDHVVEYGVSVSGVCPYKILAWSGYILCKNAWNTNKDYALKLLSASVLAMSFFLEKEAKEEKYKINQEIQIKAIKMLISELEGKSNIGIGMNGFYMIFRSLSYQYDRILERE